MLKNQKGFIHFLIIFILLVGLGTGLYLVQHPQIFKPKAQQPLPLGIAFGVNTFEEGASKCATGVTATDAQQIADAKLNWVREWVYWSAIQPSGPNSWDWSKYDCVFNALSAKGISILAPILRPPHWASAYRDVYTQVWRDPWYQSYLPPMKKVTQVISNAQKGGTYNLQGPAIDYFTVVSKNPNQNIIISPSQNPNQAVNGYYVVDYSAGKIKFFAGLTPGIVYLSYFDKNYKAFSNRPLTISPSDLGTTWFQLSSVPMLGGVHVTKEPVFAEHDGVTDPGDPVYDYLMNYNSANPAIIFTNESNFQSGDTIYLTYYILDSGPGSPWQSFLQQFSSRFSGKVQAVNIWNEASAGGVYFWGAPKNINLYAQFLHDSKSALSGMTVLDGWDDSGKVHSDLMSVLQSRGWLNDVNVLSYHDYPNTPEGAINGLNNLKSTALQYGKEVWITEMGWPTPAGSEGGDVNAGVTVSRQADYLIRTYIIVASEYSQVVKKFFWFAFDGYNPVNWGLKDAGTRVLKDSYQAVKHLNTRLDGSNFKEKVNLSLINGSGTPYVYKYQKLEPNSCINTYILWLAPDGSSGRVKLDGFGSLFDVMGNSLPSNFINGQSEIPLSSSPVFFIQTLDGNCHQQPTIPTTPTPTPTLTTPSPSPTSTPTPTITSRLTPTTLPTPTFEPIRATFTNLSASLLSNQATFNFTYSGSLHFYKIDLSTRSDMSIGTTYFDFGQGILKPIIVQSPMTRWGKYSCGRRMYWRVSNTDKTVQSVVQTAVVTCNTLSSTPTPPPTQAPQCQSWEKYCTFVGQTRCWYSFLCP